jgi:hypothetical protein
LRILVEAFFTSILFIAFGSSATEVFKTHGHRPSCVASALQNELNAGKVDFSKQVKSSHPYWGTVYKPGKSHVSMAEQKTLLRLRDRLRDSPGQAGTLVSDDEAKLLSKVLSTDVHVGQSITFGDFESRVLFPLYERRTNLTAKEAARFQPNVPTEEIYQAAHVGLMKLLRSHKETYHLTIDSVLRGEIGREIDRTVAELSPGHPIGSTNSRQYYSIERIETWLRSELQRDPTDLEIMNTYKSRKGKPLAHSDLAQYREIQKDIDRTVSIEDLSPAERNFMNRERIDTSELGIIERQFMYELDRFFFVNNGSPSHRRYLENLGLKLEGDHLVLAERDLTLTEIAENENVKVPSIFSSREHVSRQLRARLSGRPHLLNLLTLAEEGELELNQMASLTSPIPDAPTLPKKPPQNLNPPNLRRPFKPGAENLTAAVDPQPDLTPHLELDPDPLPHPNAGTKKRIDFSSQSKLENDKLGLNYGSKKEKIPAGARDVLIRIRNRILNSPELMTSVETKLEADVIRGIAPANVGVGHYMTYEDLQQHILLPALRDKIQSSLDWTQSHYPSISSEQARLVTLESVNSILPKSEGKPNREFNELILDEIKRRLKKLGLSPRPTSP